MNTPAIHRFPAIHDALSTILVMGLAFAGGLALVISTLPASA